MSRIRSRDTKPEKTVRSTVHGLGFRYRLHQKDLPGKPDIVLSRHRKIIEVRGCFFHMHNCKFGSVVPATNPEFWRDKRIATVKRDERNLSALWELGWNVLVVWECEVKDFKKLENILAEFLCLS